MFIPQSRRLALAAIVVVAASGCSLLGSEQEGASSGRSAEAEPSVAAMSPQPTVSPTATATPTPAPSATPDATDTEGEYPDRAALAGMSFAEVCALAGDEYCRDENANEWPDVWEEAAGRDPSIDACLAEDCIGTSLDDFLVSLQENTLFILDASGSMAGDAGGGQTKMDAAKEALLRYVAATPDFADLGLIVYGHQGDNSDAGRPQSCAGIETFAEVGDFTRDSAPAVVGQFQATGWTPIGAALDAAGPVLQRAVEADAAEGVEGVANRIILISDGIETCDGAPAASAQALVDMGIEVVVDVIGFDLPASDRAALQEVAAVTGGTYTEAGDGRALLDVLAAYNRQWQEAAGPINCARVALRDAVQCANILGRDIQTVVLEETRDLRGTDSARGQFLQDFLAYARDVRDERSAGLIAERTAQIEEFQAQVTAAIEAAEQFADGAFGTQKVAVRRFRCPFEDVGGGVA